MNRKTGSLIRLITLCIAATCTFALSAGTAAAGTIAYWDFNDSVDTQPANLIVDQGAGTLTSNWDDPANMPNFAGTTIGALTGPPPAQNRDLGLNGGTAQINNGRSITFAINTTGLARIQLTFAQQRSSSGFDSVQVSYSTNGDAGPFTNLGAAYVPPDIYALQSFDFGSVLDNNANIRVRLTFDGATTATGNNRLDNVRFFTGLGACCKPDNSCVQTIRSDCLQTLLGVFLGEDTACGTCPPGYPNVVMNEIRVDQLSLDFDEYIELAGNPGTSLNGLSLVVIGDGQAAQMSGVVEFVQELNGSTIPADGRFFMAGDTDTFGDVADLVLGIPQDLFENVDNITLLLVSGFRGAVGDDLDTDNDCLLDSSPWVSEIDRVALVISQVENPGVNTECHYGIFPDQIVGPEVFQTTDFVPSYIYRFDNNQVPKDGAGRPWVIGQKDVTLSDDTPGDPNAESLGACCNGSSCTITLRANCCATCWKGRDTVCSPNPCTGACCDYDTPGNCVVTNPTDCAAHSGGYSGDGTTCPCLPCLTIDQVRSMVMTTNGFTRVGVRVCNVQVSNKTDLVNSGSSKNFTIQDATGADGRSGLTVFGSNSVIDAALSGVNVRDVINMQGTLGRFRGLLELENVAALTPVQRFGPNQGPGPAITPLTIPVSTLENFAPQAELVESELVKVNCVVFLDADGTAVFHGGLGTSNYLVTDGTGTGIVRISLTTMDFEDQIIPTYPVNITGIFSQFDSSNLPIGGSVDFDDLDVYQLQPRKYLPPNNDVETATTCGPTGACCLPGPSCRTSLTASLCAAIGGIYRGDGVACGAPASGPPSNCPTTDGIVINEIRLQQPEAGGDVDEYFELKGPPNVPIGSLTYLVIGDGTGNSGTVEAVVPLKNKRMNPNGFFVVAENTFTLGTADYVPTGTNPLNFENDDNVTHMLVEGYTGTATQDLDTNDDGALDATPWTRILSIVSPVADITTPPVAPNEWWYGPTVGPVPGNFVPGHVIRCPGALNDFIIGSFAAVGGNDTPGSNNNCLGACFSCLGDLDNSLVSDINDMDEFVAALLDIAPNPCADINLDNMVNAGDIRGFITRILAITPCLPTAQRTVIRCDDAAPPCANDPGVWCIFTVDAGQAGPCIYTGTPPVPANQIAPGNAICVRCTGPGPCGGPPGSKTQFVWQNWDGSGNDCTFIATLSSANCTNCAGGVKRFTAPPLPPQIKVVAYNLLNYTSGRETEFKTILSAINPDVVIANEVNGNTGKDNFLNNVLNGAGGPGGFSVAEFTNGSDTDNALYYRTTRVTYSLGNHVTLATTPRITDRWKVSLTGYPVAPSNDIYIYSTHLKANDENPEDDPPQRAAAAAIIRSDTNALPDNSNIIVAGDFNLYTSAEDAWARFTESQGDNSGRLFDPLGPSGAGSWHQNFSFRAIHTQATRSANGGLDDRFDFQLVSSALNDGLGLTVKPGSYDPFGNDGQHYNQAITAPPTIPEGAGMATSLHDASDHLPVVMEVLLP